MRLLLALLLNVTLIGSVLAQDLTTNNLGSYTIYPVYNFKKSILSLTFDDGDPTQFSIAVPLLNERNIPATFYIITRDLNRPLFCNNVINAYNNHHEIGSHTVSHLVLKLMDKDRINNELQASRNAINSLLKTKNCLSVAYPGGLYNDTVLRIAERYYLSGRTGIQGYNNIDSIDKYKLKEMGYLSNENLLLLRIHINYSINHGLWLIEVLHGVENMGFQPINTHDLIEHLDFIKLQENRIWIATVSTVIKYSEERKTAKILWDDCNEKIYKFRLEDNLDDSIYNLPLSIIMKIPDNWTRINVSGAELVNLVFKEGEKFVMFNALPNNKEILIKPDFITSMSNELETNALTAEPNPFVDYIDVTFEVAKPSIMRLVLKNSFSQPVVIQDVSCLFPVTKVRLELNLKDKGLYILELIDKSNQKVSRRKLIR